MDKENNEGMVMEMPKYRSHKEVWALKIARIDSSKDGSAVLSFEDTSYHSITVAEAYVVKHDPRAGGYFVVYEGGYSSWSPAEVFESGYTLMESPMLPLYNSPNPNSEDRAMAIEYASRLPIDGVAGLIAAAEKIYTYLKS